MATTIYDELVTIFPLDIRYNVTKASGVEKKDGNISLYITGGIPPYIISVNGVVNNWNIINNLSPDDYDINVSDSKNSVKDITISVGYEGEPTFCSRFIIGRNISGANNCDEMCTGSTTNWLVYARGNSFKLGDRLYRVPNGYTSCLSGTVNWSTDASWDRIKYNNNCYEVDDTGVITGVTTCGEVKVGSQYWDDENLKVKVFRDGSEIQYISNYDDFIKYKGVPAYTSYEFGSSWETRGYLYNYAAINSIKNLAPVGYRIPTKSDYDTLFAEVGGLVNGGVLKSKSYWDSPNIGAENKYNYNAPGSGYFRAEKFQQIGKHGSFWTSTDSSLNNNTNYIVTFGFDLSNASYGNNLISTYDEFFPVRLIKE
jgi:uncharacterized protein (TIGR02145 family)